MSNTDASNVMELSEVARLALTSAAGADRPVWQTLFALDERLAHVLVRVREPMLAQMRFAWWRDELRKPPGDRPRGDAVLDTVGAYWTGGEEALLKLIDGWEHLLDDPPFSDEAIHGFANGRRLACEGIAERLSCGNAVARAGEAGGFWALAELAQRCGGATDRERVLRFAATQRPVTGGLPRRLRPLAVIEGLAKRAINRGGTPLVGDRGSPFVALRLGLTGR